MDTIAQAACGQYTATTLRDVSAADFIEGYAAHLKKAGDLKLPEWVDLIKTGVRKELAPYDPDWFYVRTASIARKIYLRQGLGVAALARIYGGAYRRGVRKQHFLRDSRGLVRYILGQLEEQGLVEKLGTKGGRRLTSKGRQDLDRIAHAVANE